MSKQRVARDARDLTPVALTFLSLPIMSVLLIVFGKEGLLQPWVFFAWVGSVVFAGLMTLAYWSEVEERRERRRVQRAARRERKQGIAEQQAMVKTMESLLTLALEKLPMAELGYNLVTGEGAPVDQQDGAASS